MERKWAAAQPDFVEEHWEWVAILVLAAVPVSYGLTRAYDSTLSAPFGVGLVGVVNLIGGSVLFALNVADYRLQLDSIRADHELSQSATWIREHASQAVMPPELGSVVPDSERAKYELAREAGQRDEESIALIIERRSAVRKVMGARVGAMVLAGAGVWLAAVFARSEVEKPHPTLAVIAGSGTVLEAMKAARLAEDCTHLELLMLNAGSLRGMETVLNQDDLRGVAVMATRLNDGLPKTGKNNDPLYRDKVFVEVALGVDQLLLIANAAGVPTEEVKGGARRAVFDARELTDCLANDAGCVPWNQSRLSAPESCTRARWFYPRSCLGPVNDSGTCREFRKALIEDGGYVNQDVDSDREDANVVTVVTDVERTRCGIGLSSRVTLRSWLANPDNEMKDTLLVRIDGKPPLFRGLYAYFPARKEEGKISLIENVRPLVKCVMGDKFRSWMRTNGAAVLNSKIHNKLRDQLSGTDPFNPIEMYQPPVPIKDGSGEVYFLKTDYLPEDGEDLLR